jgi:hypothetical protein
MQPSERIVPTQQRLGETTLDKRTGKAHCHCMHRQVAPREGSQPVGCLPYAAKLDLEGRLPPLLALLRPQPIDAPHQVHEQTLRSQEGIRYGIHAARRIFNGRVGLGRASSLDELMHVQQASEDLVKCVPVKVV